MIALKNSFLLKHLDWTLAFLIISNLNSTTIFDNLTTKDGLSHNKVVRIYEDRMGFLWFCTESGLNRYDGHLFKVFKNSKDDSNSLSNDVIIDIIEDREGVFWIATYGGGLNSWDPIINQFRHYRQESDNASSISSDYILTIFEDTRGNIWIGTDGGGLCRLNNKDNTFTTFLYDPFNENSISNNTIRIIHEDDSGSLWIGTDGGGVNRLDPISLQFNRYLVGKNSSSSVSHNYIVSIIEDAEYLWFGSYGGGLNKFDKKSEEFSHYKLLQSNYQSISDNVIQEICKSPLNSNIIWISLASGGVDKFNIDNETFTHIKHDPLNPNGLPSNHTTCIYEDKSGLLWVGTNGAGIAKYNRMQELIEHYTQSSTDYPSISENHILSIFQDSKGYIWVGTEGGGLNILDRNANIVTKVREKNNFELDIIHAIEEYSAGNYWIGTPGGLFRYEMKSGQITLFKNDSLDNKSISNDNIFKLLVGRTGDIWIGTLGGGLNRIAKEDINKNNLKFSHYLNEKKNSNISENNLISALYEDRQGKIWIGTVSDGLYELDVNTLTFTNYKYSNEDIYCISNNFITSIYQDKENIYWIGTYGGGLNKFNPTTKRFFRIDENADLANNVVMGLLEDNNENLWISTQSGLSKLINIYQSDTVNIKNYYKYHGFQDNQYNLNACEKLKSGELSFGGINGLNIFEPERINIPVDVQNLAITNFKIFNEDARLDTTTLYINQITLPHTKNFFSFEFSLLDFRKPDRNNYAYYLKGLEKKWNYIRNRNFATYTNIDPGRYQFIVKAANSENKWVKDYEAIDIVIIPPWWQTNIAYLSYLILLIGVVYMIWRSQTNRIKLKHDLEINEIEAEKAQELDRLKSRFFANISHEFRTPLTLIEGPVKQLKNGEFQGNIKEVYELILKNTTRLLGLINQLLDLSKLEAKKLKLKAAKQNIIPLLSGLVQSFESVARTKRIEYSFINPDSETELFVDQDKFEKIIINLLSNAFKFTPYGGRITVEMKNLPDLFFNFGQNLRSGVQISITNSGTFLTTEQIEHIFDRFYQINEYSTDHLEGTGIGLALVKELVELHRGQISVKSDREKGTTFTLTLPHGKDQLLPEEICIKPAEIFDPGQVPLQLAEYIEKKSKPISLRTPARQSILIVEDNKDVRSYVVGLINSEYGILEAENGEKALEIARKKNPDLVITDVMMPEMNGMEFCKQLKEDIEISHIPVIMLTARAAIEDKLEGLELGADDYIGKPFEARELRLKIKNVISQRERLRTYFGREFSINTNERTLTTVDEQFIQKLIGTIDREMHRPDLSVIDLSESLNVSRATLNRKIKSLTGLSPAKLLRSLRLKKARQLLREEFGNISEVAYEVGFDSPSHFSSIYKKHFGVKPSTEFQIFVNHK